MADAECRAIGGRLNMEQHDGFILTNLNYTKSSGLLIFPQGIATKVFYLTICKGG